MSARLDKIGVEWKHAVKKAQDWSERAKELERKYRETENTEIHDLVHEAQLTPDQLAEVLKALKSGLLPSPAVLAGGGCIRRFGAFGRFRFYGGGICG